MISLNHVTKRYGRIIGLQDVDLHIEKGQIAGLLGRNGAGKTTALNLMTGYLSPDEGNVTVNGLNMMEKPAECKRNIGYLPECPPLYDEMTVTEYLNFVCDLKEVSPRSQKTHVEEVLRICSLQEMRGRVIGRLSKGYRQRVGIAQALCGSPEILILDEPTVGLDPKQIVEIRELIHMLGEDHTILFSTHILNEAQQLCSHAYILHGGKLIRSFDLNQNQIRDQIRIRMSIRGNDTEYLPSIRSIGCVLQADTLEIADGSTVIRVIGREKDDRGPLTDQLFYLFSAMNTPIRQMTIEKNDLEEVFLKATAD